MPGIFRRRPAASRGQVDAGQRMLFVPAVRAPGGRHSTPVISRQGLALVPVFTSEDALAEWQPDAGRAALRADVLVDLVRNSGAKGILVDAGSPAEATVALADLPTYFADQLGPSVEELTSRRVRLCGLPLRRRSHRCLPQQSDKWRIPWVTPLPSTHFVVRSSARN